MQLIFKTKENDILSTYKKQTLNYGSIISY